MKKHVAVLLVWGVAIGLGLRYSIPLMKDMGPQQVLVLSACLPFMFVPSALLHSWGHTLLMSSGIQLGIGAIAAIICGYYFDTLMSYSLVAGLAALLLWVASKVAKALSYQMILFYGLSFLAAAAGNIIGHGFESDGWLFVAKIIGVMALSFAFCTGCTLAVTRG